MKAILLAAGAGTRLRPLTDRLPKCLVPIEGEPLLGLWFRLLRRHGVTSVLVNTHHLADQVGRFAESARAPGFDITLFHEPELLGTAGTVWANRAFLAGEPEFLVIYADNLTNADLSKFVQYHRDKRSPFTMGLFETPAPEQGGIAVLDADGRVAEFVEKPKQPRSNLANAGMYLAGPALFDLLPQKPFMDFGFDILPLMVGRMFGYRIPEYYCDLGTPERLERARREWPRAIGQKR